MHTPQSYFRRGLIGRSLLLIWIAGTIVVFVYVPGRMNFVQWAKFSEWKLLPERLTRFAPGGDFLGLLGSCGTILLFSMACVCLGRFVSDRVVNETRLASISTFSGLAWLATDFLIGHGLLSSILLLLAGLYRLTPLETWSILLLCVLTGFRRIKINRAIFKDMKSFSSQFVEDRTALNIAWLAVSIVGMTVFYSSSRISYDASAIYFSAARLTAMRRSLSFFVDDTFVASTFHSVIQYAALIQLFGDQAARLFSWVCGLIFIAFCTALGEELGLSRRGVTILLAMLVTSTAFLDLMGDGKIDLVSSAPAMGAIYWMVVEAKRNSPNRLPLLLAGFLTGLAIVARPFNVFLIGLFIVLFYGQRAFIRRGFGSLSFGLLARASGWIGIGVVGFGLFHLFVNRMILGDPLAFLSSVSRIDPSAGPWDYDPNRILTIRLLYPLVATFYNSTQTLGNISPLFLGFLPALFLHQVRSRLRFSSELLILVGISAAVLIAWISVFFTVYELRYVLFLWAILYIPVAEIAAIALESGDSVLRNSLSALILLLLGFMLVRTLYISIDTFSPVDRAGNPQCFCDYWRQVNRVAAPGERVLTLTGFRYYLRSDLFACSTQHEEYRRLQSASRANSDAFWQEVHRQGYDYLAYEDTYALKHLQLGLIPGPDNAPAWLQLEPVYGKPGDPNVIYRLHFRAAPEVEKAVCQKDPQEIWKIIPAK